MATEVILPKVDMDMTTGTISKWYVEDGASVKKGQAIFDIETDKAAMEIEAPVEGVIKIGNAAVGFTLPIATVVAMIFGSGETPAAADKATPGVARVSPAAPTEKLSNATVVSTPQVGTIGSSATPLARRIARQKGVDLSLIKDSGPPWPRGCRRCE